MSQFFVNSSGSSPPPQVPTTFHTQNGDATPSANIINFFAGQTVNNNDDGIDDNGSGNTVTYVLTNRNTGSLTTTTDIPASLLSLFLGSSPGVVYVWGNVQAFDLTTPGTAGAAFSFSGAFRTDGTLSTQTELGVEYHDTFQEAAISACDIQLVAGTGNNTALLQVIGINGDTIHWNGLIEYRRVN